MEFEDRTSELDHIVIGPNGVFVIETKNLNGYIEGQADGKEWIHHKIGRRGGEYSKTFYSPIKQVGTQVYRLSSFLKQNGIHSWVQGVVYFSNSEAEVAVNTFPDSIPVFQASEGGTKEMQHFIEDFQKEPLSQEKQKQIVSLLKKIA